MPRYARVIVDHNPDREFDYEVPPALEVAIGSRVRVPFGHRAVLGTVVDLPPATEAAAVKPITAVIGAKPLIPPKLVELARWMADYYCCPVETAMRGVLPQVIRKAEVGYRTQIFARLIRTPAPDEIGQIRKRAPRQADVVEFLIQAGAPVPVAELAAVCHASRPTLRALEDKGIVSTRHETMLRDPHAGEQFLPARGHVLNASQLAAFEATRDAIHHPGKSKPILLHGVTGSGKTEIYLQAIEEALLLGKTAIVLVPEISLTPQTVERFKSRFADSQQSVAVLHSHLSAGERHDEWHKIHEGRARIVIGARSAIFAPLDRLGLIVVDEEHENSYKQEESPRYHARDLAVVRARMEPCAVLLGSATPSLESYYNARRGKYHLVNLRERVDNQKMPFIRVIDLRLQSPKMRASSILSPRLCAAIDDRLAKAEQTILFLNRRGFSTALTCEQCGHVCHCANCSLPMTHHRAAARLVCHLCGESTLVPVRCPACKDPNIRHSGTGTEKVEDAVTRLFPKARVARMDADSMTRKDAYRDTLHAFRTGKIDILVGTQMIAKGLHFPNVTLVGIINADLTLHLPDFRAGERTFQLITQVAGRAGRGDVTGEVFVQTYTPFSPSIQFARHHDFEEFSRQELDFRKEWNYPPFSHMILVTLRSRSREKAEFSAQTLARKLRDQLPPDATLGEPAPAPIEKLKGQFRCHLAMRAKSVLTLSRHLRTVLQKLPFPADVHATIDVDPFQLM